jgi:hypothetical protein
MRRLVLILGLLVGWGCDIDPNGNDPGTADAGCEAICDAAANGEAGAADAAADAGAVSVPTAGAFCLAYGYADCERKATCGASTGSLDYCKSLTDFFCAGAVCAGSYTPSAGAACVTDVRVLPCDDVLAGATPPSCAQVCP